MAGVDHESSEHDPIALARRNWEDAGWGGDVADGMEAVTSVMRAHQIMLARVEQELKPFGLTFARFELLRLLAFTRQGALPISKASDRLQVHVSSATHAIGRLAEAGLVERLPHPTDGRTTLVSITGDGRELVEKATAVLNSSVFADVGMSVNQSRQLVDAIRSLRHAHGDF
ncbi:MarR family transcriptional regulator [Gordonia sp. (in: high G+C Gram-positive bacteria)]|uniref:MarR family transcriptional regulator n=1 Tax=Gordonia sp. (in: high G+C Gram-positive bacteria) TaxID=84139 RepID=UPI003C755B9B